MLSSGETSFKEKQVHKVQWTVEIFAYHYQSQIIRDSAQKHFANLKKYILIQGNKIGK